MSSSSLPSLKGRRPERCGESAGENRMYSTRQIANSDLAVGTVTDCAGSSQLDRDRALRGWSPQGGMPRWLWHRYSSLPSPEIGSTCTIRREACQSARLRRAPLTRSEERGVATHPRGSSHILPPTPSSRKVVMRTVGLRNLSRCCG